jgi:AcrR family transcriptional regulator
MAVKQRAVGAQDKEERRTAILDAAEKLYLKHPDRIASVAEVALAAGLAKGTVYLYFPGKEEMLLALHQRHVERFFARMVERLGAPGAVGFDQVFAVTRDHFIRVPGYIALTSRCFAMMDREIPLDVVIAFKKRVGLLLAEAGAGLARHFPLTLPQGVTILMHSYALIVGLWQLVHPNERLGKAMDQPALRALKLDYEREVEAALRALWSGALAAAQAPALPRRKTR